MEYISWHISQENLSKISVEKIIKVADKIVAVKVVTAEFHCKDEKYGIGLLLNSRNDKNKYMVEMNQNDAVSFLKMLYSNGVVDMSEFNAVKIEWTRGW